MKGPRQSECITKSDKSWFRRSFVFVLIVSAVVLAFGWNAHLTLVQAHRDEMLMQSINQADAVAAKYWLDQGADPRFAGAITGGNLNEMFQSLLHPGRKGPPALHFAVMRDQYDIAELLLQRGAGDVNAVYNTYGR